MSPRILDLGTTLCVIEGLRCNMCLLYILLIHQVNEDRTKVKRIRPLPELKNVDERTVYVVGILT